VLVKQLRLDVCHVLFCFRLKHIFLVLCVL
jgi:hypothetical protein